MFTQVTYTRDTKLSWLVQNVRSKTSPQDLLYFTYLVWSWEAIVKTVYGSVFDLALQVFTVCFFKTVELHYSEERTNFVKIFKNWVPRKLFGCKRNEQMSEWRTLHNEELHSIYTASNPIRFIEVKKLRWVKHAGYTEK